MKASRFSLLLVSAFSLNPAFPARAQTCDLFPIALPAQQLSNAAPGIVLTNIFNGPQPGDFGWLTWAGSPSEPALVASLTAPGDSSTYVNPDNGSDHQVSIGDWVQGKPGVSNGKKVRDVLDALKQIDITVPVWDQARGQGANAAYRVSGFARIRLLDYQLPGQNRITARYIGQAMCGFQNHAPVVSPGGDQTITLPDSATLTGAVTDDGLPVGSALSVTWAQLSGPASAVVVSPHATNSVVQFSQPGTYAFSLTASDSDLAASNTLVVTVNRANEAPVAFSQNITNRRNRCFRAPAG